jgi:hypothetical protein
MRRVLLAVAVMVLVSLTGETRPAQADKGYGMAGCGLGSIVFGNKPGMVQILAATTNATFGTQTFGITSGTSNCKDAGGGATSAKSFIETNREAFAKDVSRGSGETIVNLSALAGCRDAKMVGAKLQANFKAIFPSAGIKDTEVSAKAVAVLKADGALACSRLI